MVLEGEEKKEVSESDMILGIQDISTKKKDKFGVFEDWLLENGAEFSSLELRDYPEVGDVESSKNSESLAASANDLHGSEPDDTGDNEMRGVHAKIGIPPGTVCMTIPRQCLITVEMGKATEIGQRIVEADLELDAPKHIFLMIYLLVDRQNTSSFFRPYYDILPKTLRNMPIMWNEEELSYLKGSYLLNQIEERIEAIEEDYESICQVVPEFGNAASLEDFKWARMCVCSRNFGLLIDGIRTSALVPHADMLNHHRPRETKWTFDSERDAFTITTLQTISGGAEVFDSYGQKCNHRFLLNYGFAIENNREIDGFCPNEVPLELSLLPSDPLHELKSAFWSRDGSPDLKRVRVCVSNNENTKSMLSMLRVIVANDEEMSSVSCSGLYMFRTAKDIRFPLSLRNERAALEQLLRIVRRTLSEYSTSLEEDIKALESDRFVLFSNIRNAIIQVKGEKEVLHHFENFAVTAINVMDLNDADCVSATVAVQHSQHHTIAVYCLDVIGPLRRKN
eukprot:CAMPEP_0194265332 /NCGR_PEP_ID=MMETSP0169-20130528/614_1 /TAXON_ID=218684 /ORGANISM="Corethron pennatum, Strain L29A3" /LENGTH=508 /DNA_ID=CAMNT_0039005773 /DNA_START=142 /DNA_END=1668 /DNA_ORIENTATION=+